MASTFLDRVSNKALGELLVEKGALSEAQVNDALDKSRKEGIRLGEALVALGLISRDALGYALGEQYGLTPVELHPSMVDTELLSRFNFELLSAHTMLPLIELGRELVVVVSDPNNQQGLMELSMQLPDYTLTPQLGAVDQIRRCLEAVRPQAERSSRQSLQRCGDLTNSETARDLPYFKEVPTPQTPQFIEWLIGLSASHPSQDVLIREAKDGMRVSITPRVNARHDSPDSSLTNINTWPDGDIAALKSMLLQRSFPVEHTRGQAAHWTYSISYNGNCHDFLVLIPITHGTQELRLRALTHRNRDDTDDDASSAVPLNPRLEAGKYTVVLYDESVSLEKALVQFTEDNADEHTFVIAQQATRCAFSNAYAYPAPFVNMVTAVQASAATCAIFDYPVDYRETVRLLAGTNPPPAVLVCAPMPSYAGGAGSMSPDVEELISRQGAQSVRLMGSESPDTSEGGND